MTWKRLLSRNGIADGDYQVVPWNLQARVALRGGTVRTDEEAMVDRAPSWRDRIEEYEGWARNFAGDLRRLEHDIADEGALCGAIAHRTGIDSDTVAAVLKEFLAL